MHHQILYRAHINHYILHAAIDDHPSTFPSTKGNMTSENPPNRWLILFASLIINICIGSIYAWSVFQKPLMDILLTSASDTALAFSLSLGIAPIVMIIAGRIQDAIGPKPVIFAGGIIFGTAMALTGFVTNLTMLYLTYGILGGAGIGAIYACTVANTVKFFPDKRGLAAGLVVAGFGSGAVLFAPLSSWLIEQYTVLPVFKMLGVAFVALISLCATQIRAAPVGFAPAGWTPPAPASGSATRVSIDKNWKGMLSDPLFFVLYGAYILGSISGLMFLAHASPIAQEVIGVTPTVAAAAVGIMALANTGGRVFWGWVSDRIGRFNVLYVMFAISALLTMALTQVTSYVPFVVALTGVMLCFGGFMGCFPSITADAFGSRNLGMNYSIIFTACSISSLIGPRLAARVKEMNDGDYTIAFIIVACLSVLGIALSFLAKRIISQPRKP